MATLALPFVGSGFVSALDDGSDPDKYEGAERYQRWAARLARAMDARAMGLQTLRDYYDGIHPKTFATEKWKEVFGDQFGEITDNWGGRVVDGATERMLLQGFRKVGDAPGPQGTVPADDIADAIWRRSRMHVQSDIAHTDGLATGYSYVSVHLAGGKARLRVEDPLQTFVEHDPETGVDRLAAFKRWRGVDGSLYAVLYLPDAVVRMSGPTSAVPEWTITGQEGNSFGEVPVFEFANNPDVHGCGRSDLLPMMSLGDAAEKLLSDMVVTSEFAAFPQRVILGGEVPTDAEGNPVSAAVLGVARLFAIEAENAKIDQFQAADLSNYVTAIEMIVQHIAALTQIPPHYLLGKLANLSGDALAAAESALVSKVRRRTKVFGETWSDAMALAHRMETGGNADFVTLWENPERVSDAQKGDYLSKLSSFGVPFQALIEEIKEPAVVDRWVNLKQAEDARLAELDAQASGISGPSGLPTQ